MSKSDNIQGLATTFSEREVRSLCRLFKMLLEGRTAKDDLSVILRNRVFLKAVGKFIRLEQKADRLQGAKIEDIE